MGKWSENIEAFAVKHAKEFIIKYKAKMAK